VNCGQYFTSYYHYQQKRFKKMNLYQTLHTHTHTHSHFTALWTYGTSAVIFCIQINHTFYAPSFHWSSRPLSISWRSTSQAASSPAFSRMRALGHTSRRCTSHEECMLENSSPTCTLQQWQHYCLLHDYQHQSSLKTMVSLPFPWVFSKF